MGSSEVFRCSIMFHWMNEYWGYYSVLVTYNMHDQKKKKNMETTDLQNSLPVPSWGILTLPLSTPPPFPCSFAHPPSPCDRSHSPNKSCLAPPFFLRCSCFCFCSSLTHPFRPELNALSPMLPCFPQLPLSSLLPQHRVQTSIIALITTCCTTHFWVCLPLSLLKTLLSFIFICGKNEDASFLFVKKKWTKQ